MLDEEKISIIVPVYNVEPFIRKCVKSLVNQTYKNIEIILVDDGSPDNCGKICDAFAKEDNRIKVIHKENGGLCSARNAGLELATGEYIGFVDSDDWVSEDMFEYLLINAKEHNSDITCCRYYRVTSKGIRVTIQEDKLCIYNKREAIEELINNLTMRALFWNKLFKRKIFNNIRFPEGKVYEGTYLMHKVFELSEKIIYIPEPKYYYFDFVDSIVNSKSIKNQSDYVCAHIRRYNDLKEQYPQLKDRLMKNIIKESITLIKICYKRKEEIKGNIENLQIIGKFINDNYTYISEMNITNKITMKKLDYLISLSMYCLIRAYYLIKLGKLYKKFKKKFNKFKKKLRNKINKENKSARVKVQININDLTHEDKQIFNKLHKTEVEILDEFVRICDKYNLKYYLYGGTLLGAVRHEGFIPWDDDVDIVMLREDYEKFGNYCEKELNKKFFYQTCFTDSEFPLLLAKIRLNDSYVKENRDELELHHGIYIDILPLDNFPTSRRKGNKILKKFQWINRICNTENIRTLNMVKKIVYKTYKMLPKKFNYRLREKLLEKSNSFDGENVCSFGSHYKPIQKRILKKSWFNGDEYMLFEGRKYRVPSGWREYLIHLFGESYMEMPPVEKRVNHFNFYDVVFDTNQGTDHESSIIYK